MSVHYDDHGLQLLVGDCREQMRELPAGIARTCVTSPPYWRLRDYAVAGQLGQEASPHEYVANLVEVFREVRRVLTKDGTLWLNLGDSYQNKSLVGIPWMVALALREDGWILRSDIVWHKTNPMPESVTDRPTKGHEYVFLMARSDSYFYDAESIRERCLSNNRGVVGVGARNKLPNGAVGGQSGLSYAKKRDNSLGRNRRSVWTMPSGRYQGAHFATMPKGLVEPCIKAGSAVGDTVLDPFSGAGTTGLVARRLGRSFVGTELNAQYADITVDRWRADGLLV